VLRSERTVQVTVAFIRAVVSLRQMLAANDTRSAD
jgi:hypothetical protein